MIEMIFCLFLGLQIKHFFVDFLLQPPFMYKNKGTYGHMGGIAHAGLHAFFTGILFIPFGWLIACTACLFDGVTHYHIDFVKVNLGRIFKLKPDNSEWFWILLGFDQFLHQMTYLLLVFVAVNSLY